MSLFRRSVDDSDTIRPSLLQDGFLALGCLILGIGLLRMDAEDFEGAVLVAAFVLVGAVVIMAAHLPGCTGIWLDGEGFLVREMYRSERYRWSEVGPFMVRRRMLGLGVDFSYMPTGETVPVMRSLPRGLGDSGWKIALRMNGRRERAVGTGN